MGRLVALVMLALIAGLITQAVRGDAPIWVSAVSLPAAAIGIGLAGARTLPAAQRLGTRIDEADVQHRLGRGILRDHRDLPDGNGHVARGTACRHVVKRRQ